MRLFASVLLTALTSVAALAQDWPSKPITIVYGIPGRLGRRHRRAHVAGFDGEIVNARIITEYRSGAGGNIASEYVAKARATLHDIARDRGDARVNAALYKSLPFDVEADFTPIAPLVDVSNC